MPGTWPDGAGQVGVLILMLFVSFGLTITLENREKVLNILGKYPSVRLRRNRRDAWNRRMVAENILTPCRFYSSAFRL